MNHRDLIQVICSLLAVCLVAWFVLIFLVDYFNPNWK